MAEDTTQRKQVTKIEVACFGYKLILPKLKKLLILEKEDSKELRSQQNNIEIIKKRLKKILDNPKYSLIKNILVKTPLWDNELNILANKLQSNV